MTVLADIPALTWPQLIELQARVAVTISLHPDLKGHPMGKTTKADLVEHLVLGNSITKAYAQKLVDQTLEFITDRVNAGETVFLTGFGTFEQRRRDARTGRNPRTGEAVEIAASTSMGFRPSKRAGK